ncbi:SNF2 family N-terminal domain-containing protein [Chlamydoabsidia padenii]|nr:SNF2 family N-terminal domain-containing protein [Chlamydoabsidia padenii]
MLQLATNGPPSVTPATKTVKRKRQIKALTSDDDSDSGDDDRPRRRRRAVRSTNNEQQLVKAAQAVAFFNTAKPQEIMDVTGCNLAQTEKLIHLRPFDHLQDLSGKLKAQAGLSVNYVKTYMDVMEGYSAVDEIIEQVEHIGGQLQPILNIWETIGLSTSPTTLKDEGGTHLVEVDNGEPGTVNTSSTIYKDAMEGYLSSQPAIVNPAFTLKSYQLVGVNWMLLLYRKGISGILADEMGLGKTAQVISFLGRLQELGESGPHMVVVPASTMNNWLREFERFCPTLNVRCYYGSQADRLIQQKEMMAERNDIHAVVTTYSMVSGNAEDHSFLRKLGCKSLILDEGHMIKNYTSARYGHLMRLKIPFRLLLTGTPLQNNLQELVSLLIFIMPGVFSGNEDEVHKIFKLKNSSTINNNSDSTPSKAAQLLSQQRIARAKKMMTPFVLRRRKQQVLVHLPKKIHHLEYCTMTPHQENLYTSLVSTWQNQYNNLALDNDDHVTKNNKRKLNNIVMQLRKAADHPLLFRHIYNDDKIKQMAKDIMKEDYYLDANEQFIYEDMEVMTDFELDRLSREFKTIEHHRLMNEEWMDAGKIRYLQQLLPEMKRQGNKVLIFSQFVMMLDILELVMETLGLTFTRLDGSTKVDERQDLIDNFNQDPDVTVFLLGTKAGGFGINLTSANVVVMYDMDFNPQNDKQAEDRAHRVGQTRNVNVYKLVSTHTIEDQILAMADIRLRLDSTVSGNDQEDPDISKMKSLIKSALLPL